jgi:site-specific recombinase XerD
MSNDFPSIYAEASFDLVTINGRPAGSLLYGFLENFNSKNTKVAYRYDLSHYFIFINKFFKIDECLEVRHENIVAYKNYLEKGSRAGSKKENFSLKTVNRKLSALYSFYKHLCDMGICSINPIANIKRPPVSSEIKTSGLTDIQVKKLLSSVDQSQINGKRDFAILTILFMTGMRNSELSNLKFSSINHKEGMVILRFVTKGGDSRVIPLNEETQTALFTYIDDIQSNNQDQAGLTVVDGDGFIFKGSRGRESSGCMTHASINNIVKKYCKTAGIEGDFTAHSSRVTVISNLLEKHSVHNVAEFIGHKSIKTTDSYNKRSRKLEDSLSFDVSY